MGDEDRAGVLADEQARNAAYMAHLVRKAQTSTAIGVSRSTSWTRHGHPVHATIQPGPFIGRVALTEVEPLLGTDSFYIGPSFCDAGEMQVISWAARASGVFFGDPFDRFDAKLQARRTFEVNGTRVTAFEDERLGDALGPTAFDRRTPLQVTRPPSRDRRAERLPEPRHPLPPMKAPQPPVTVVAPRKGMPPLRAEASLRRALAAPRQKELRHVLATMQPDQYRLVTSPADEPLIIQGHPGSGKTVIALHRAAWLSNPEAEEHHRKRVLLLGPTPGFVAHTRGVLSDLPSNSLVAVSSVGGLLRSLCTDLPAQLPLITGSHADTDEELAPVIREVATGLRAAGRLPGAMSLPDRIRVVYAHLPDAGRWTDRGGSDHASYLAALPPWATAVRDPRLAPLLACCGLWARPAPPPTFDHIIVDEAQDLRPLEWHLLSSVNAGGEWTVVGDTNQRRCETSFRSWDQVARALTIDVDGRARVEQASAVFRSTSGILAFANKLLPAAERAVRAIQHDDVAPHVAKHRAKDLAVAAVGQAVDLVDRHPSGTVAVIAVDTAPFRRVLVTAGWRTGRPGSSTWERGSQSLRVLAAADARGLEFDAVVVVEPDDFPATLGRHGLLYTSLTRANRELVVVHARPLPEGLRRRR